MSNGVRERKVEQAHQRQISKTSTKKHNFRRNLLKIAKKIAFEIWYEALRMSVPRALEEITGEQTFGQPKND